MTPEGRVKKWLKKYLADEGYYQFWPVQTGYGQATVDCLAWHKNNGSLALECKREGLTKPTPRQTAVMREMRKAGVRTFIVTFIESEPRWLEQLD